MKVSKTGKIWLDYHQINSKVAKAGNLVSIHLRPHDLRRHAAPMPHHLNV